MMDIVQTLGIILSVSSITLSIVAILFAWVSYKHSTEMQIKAQAILEQVSQKVEVLVKLTSSQIERAWDYFTQSHNTPEEKKEEISFNIEELRKQIIAETKEETEKLIEDAGIERGKIDLVISKLEGLLNKSTEKTQEIFNKQKILDRYTEVEFELKKWFERKMKWIFPPNIFMVHMLENEEIRSVLPKNMLKEIRVFIDTRNKVAHSKPVTDEEMERALKLSYDFLSFLRND